MYKWYFNGRGHWLLAMTWLSKIINGSLTEFLCIWSASDICMCCWGTFCIDCCIWEHQKMPVFWELQCWSLHSSWVITQILKARNAQFDIQQNHVALNAFCWWNLHRNTVTELINEQLSETIAFILMPKQAWVAPQQYFRKWSHVLNDSLRLWNLPEVQ